jgi:hypothetical protein
VEQKPTNRTRGGRGVSMELSRNKRLANSSALRKGESGAGEAEGVS